MQEAIEHTGVRKTYPQDWRAYNAAQTSEKAQFLKFLHALCAGIEEPEQTNGRPRIPLRDVIFSICYKIYSTVSGRRFMTDLREAKTNGYIERTPHYNSLFNYLENPALFPILKSLIVKSSLPLTAIEQDFAIDSSGFTTSQLAYWRQHKYRKKKQLDVSTHVKDWVKVHIACGVRTNIVTSVEIGERHSNDTIFFGDLVQTTSQNFPIRDVCADRAYTSGYNLKIVDDIGATAFIPFRANHSPGTKGDLWQKMYHYFRFREDEFMAHYHKRSNVETTFSMIKAKFGGFVRSKTETAMKNEALAKILAHNICVLIQEMHELGIDVDFCKRKIYQ